MRSDRISKHIIALLILVSLVISGGLSTSLLSSRADEGTAELELLFDPGLLKQHVSLTDDYGERPLPPPLPPDTEDPYQPNLEGEYY